MICVHESHYIHCNNFTLWFFFSKQNVVFLLQSHLELGSGSIHVGDHGADVTDDGGEDEHTDQEVDRHEDVLPVDLWLRCFTDRCQCKRGPIKTVIKYIYLEIIVPSYWIFVRSLYTYIQTVMMQHFGYNNTKDVAYMFIKFRLQNKWNFS